MDPRDPFKDKPHYEILLTTKRNWKYVLLAEEFTSAANILLYQRKYPKLN